LLLLRAVCSSVEFLNYLSLAIPVRPIISKYTRPIFAPNFQGWLTTAVYIDDKSEISFAMRYLTFLSVLSRELLFVTPVASGAARRANVGLRPQSNNAFCTFYFFCFPLYNFWFRVVD